MGSLVFDGVSYYLAEKSVQEPAEVKQLLRQGGAVREFYMSDLVTHIITDSPLDPSTTVNPDFTIIHSDWVKVSMKCEVMLPTAPFELSDDKLFSGLVFCPSKLSRSDTEKLCVLVAYYGGRMQRRLDPNVTHLVTVETTGAKYECAVKHADTIKIVTPDWVLDCIDLGKRLAEGEYHPSPTPPTAGGSPSNSSHGDGGNVTHGGVTLPECNGERETNVQTSQLDKQEMVSSCTSAAGVVDLPVEEERVLISKLPAVLEGPEGDSPEPGGREGVGGAVVESLGELRLRVKLKDQVTSVNEETPDKSTTFPDSNTSGLSQAGNSSPTLKASTATPHPDHPPRLLQGMTFFFTDYQECMDNETIAKWKEVVVQHGGHVLGEYDPEQCTHLLALHKKSNVFDRALANEKCIASAHWLNDILTDQKMYPPRHALHFPTAFKWQLPGAEDYSITLTNYTDLERELVKDMIRITGIPYTGFLCRETTHLVCRRAVGKKYNKAVEWGVQVVNASFLTDIIHNGQVPAVLFPQHTALGCPDEFSPNTCFEASRLLKPWEAFMSHYAELHHGLVDRQASQSSLQATPSSSHKRGRGQGAGGSDGEMKKLKLSSDKACCDKNQSKHFPVSQRGLPTVLFTGISQPVVKKLKTIVQRLGGVVTDKARECTHTVAPRITRTVKFLCGISVCEHVVTPEWVERSGRGAQFMEEAAFALCDRDAEEMFGMDLATSLARAKEKKLLEGLCFYSTPHVQPPHDSLREIIECAGGELLSRIDVDSRFGEQFKSLPSSTEQFIVISCPEDVDSDHCSEFFKHGIAVYNAEFVLTGVLKQELDFSQNKIVH